MERLGDGAEGGAWRAVHDATGASVVAKPVVAEDLASVRQAFEVLRRLGSPHLPVPRAIEDDARGGPWLITEWVAGAPLAAGPTDVRTALREVAAVARGLAALHDAGTHHGDVSPGNVIADDERLTLVDLATLGRRGTGTPGFMAPEVLAGGGGPAADRFSLGCLLAWRLWGRSVWRRPEALLRVRGRRDVADAVDELGASALAEPVRDLLIRLLLPDSESRPSSTRDVAAALSSLSDPSASVSGAARWWTPRRWPYLGTPLAPALQSIVEGDVRLVVVAADAGAGRSRVVEELVLGLQARGRAARRVAPAGSWIAAWVEAPADAPVAGMLVPPVDLDDAARLRAGVRLCRAPALVPGTVALGEALQGEPGIMVVRPVAESADVVASWLDCALDASEADRQALARALVDATGGWPASLVRLAEACARVGATADQVAHVATQAPARAMSPGLARAVLRASWGESNPSLPETVAPGGDPHPVACARARAALGEREVQALARASMQPGLARAIDAGDRDVVLELLGARRPDDPEVARAVAAIESRGWQDPALVAFAMQRRLAEGDAHAAASLAARAPDDPDCRFAHARALQRLGRGDDARALLSVRAEDPAPRRWACRGLRWRLDVDAGEAAAADAEATACGVDALALEEAGAGGALALLWSAYAAWSCGATERATARLAAGRVWADASRDADASSIAARLLQLDGNLAYGRGSLTEAAARFAAAAEAFARAGEPVGGLTLRGTACALAGPTLDLQAGIAHGRAALRGLLAHGQTSALVEAAINLVQLLARVGGDDEARTVATAVRAAVGQGAVAIDRARLCRLDADVLVRPGASTHDARRRAAKAYAVAAAALAEAGLEDEAHDASVRAATFFTIAGDFDAAAEVLVDVPAAPTSPGLHIAACTVRAQLAARRGDAPALETAVASLHTGPRWSALRAAGRLESALAYDKTLLLAVRSQPASSATTRRALAARLLSTVESVMQKTKPIDRPAARAALLSEGGDTSVLRDLLEDLEGTDAPAPAQASAAEPASGGDRYERLLRMYRRFAREDRLEPLLEQIVDAVMELTDAERGAVVIRRVEVEDLSVTRALAEGSGGASYSRSVIERVLASGEPVLSVDAAADDRFDDSRSISHLNLRSVLAVPLRFRGTLLGAAYVDHRLRRGNFGEDDLAHMEAFADLAALAVAHAAALTSLEDKTTQLTAQSAQLAALLERREAEVVALREDARRQAPARDGYRGIIGSSVRMQTVFRMIDRVADADVPVVVYGESGTGKELVARALHDAGGRGSGPFVAENCGAIPETLLESVLFGHAKGAFTGAQKAKAGLFEAANGGTIFLDEVSEMGMPMQTKLLRVLQEGEVRRVGETAARAVDVRVVAACNRDLEEMVAEGTFRRDLYYRINVVRIDLPPLRERVEDIRALIDHFLARHGGTQLELAPSVVRALTAYAWPGNVRQLENEVQRWVALCEGGVALEDLSGPIAGTSAPEPFDPDDLRIRPRVDRMERELIARALEQTGNNQTKAAALLGLSRYGLQKKLKRLAQG